ncbi:MAG: hypothetical protein ACXVCP_18180, partial [Bdellovibrio sp.]
MKLYKFLKPFVNLFFVSMSINCLADEPPIHLKCLWASYQNFKITPDKKDIILTNGQTLPYRSRETGEVDPTNLTSIDQMYLDRYPYGFSLNSLGKLSYVIPQKKNILRGNRYEPLFLYLYGDTPRKVEADLVPVHWLDGSIVLFNKRYGAAWALMKVVYELYELTIDHPEITKYLRRPLGGTYQWRRISHSKNLSAHS